MGKADLHAHTCHDGWGDGNQNVEQFFQHVERCTDLDIVAITDHDSTTAARVGLEMHRSGNFRFDFLPGVEVTNQAGHLLCYFPSGEIHDLPSLRPFWWTVRYACERGAICIPAHPIYPPWLRTTILRGIRNGHRIHGVEIMNGGISPGAQENLSRRFAGIDSQLAVVGNSDAHDQSALGSVYTEFPGTSVHDFIEALHRRRTRPVFVSRPVLHPAARHFTARRSMTRPGWVRNLWREVVGGP